MTFGQIKSAGKGSRRALALGRMIEDGFGATELTWLQLIDLWRIRCRAVTWLGILAWLRVRPGGPCQALFLALHGPHRPMTRDKVEGSVRRFAVIWGVSPHPPLSRWRETIPPAPRYTLSEFLDRTRNQTVLGTPLPPRPEERPTG